MSGTELSINQKDVINGMESGTFTWTISSCTATANYCKKDNVIQMIISIKPTATISDGTTITSSNALLENLRPKINCSAFASLMNSGSSNIYPTIVWLYTSGKITVQFWSGRSSSWSANNFSFTYLVN